jgi:hypothetical protein
MAAVTAALSGDPTLVLALTMSGEWTHGDNVMLAMWAAQGIAYLAQTEGRDVQEVLQEMGAKLAEDT